MLKIHFAVILFGITGLFSKFLDLPATVIVFGRCLFGAAILLYYIKIAKINLKFNSTKDFSRAILSGIIIGISWYFFFESIKISTVSIGLLTYASVAIFTTFIEAACHKKRPNFVDLSLALGTFLGVILIIPKFSLSDNTTLGVVYGLCAAFTAALFTVMSKSIVSKYSSIKLAFFQYATVTILFTPFIFFEKIDYSLYNISLIAVLGIVFTGFANTLFINALKKISAAKANIILTLEPIYGTFLAIIFLNEKLTINIAMGGSIVLVAALLATALSNTDIKFNYKTTTSLTSK
jgi:drug/metabolite transporter (DMT)-like permease